MSLNLGTVAYLKSNGFLKILVYFDNQEIYKRYGDIEYLFDLIINGLNDDWQCYCRTISLEKNIFLKGEVRRFFLIGLKFSLALN